MSRRASSVMIADSQALVREALAQVIGSLGPFRIALVTGQTTELLAAAERETPAIAILDVSIRQALSAAQTIAARWPKTRLILLDESRRANHLRIAETLAAEYVTKCNGLADFGAILVRGDKDERASPARPHRGKSASKDTPNGDVDLITMLTPRELEVLALLAEGLAVRECASRCGISTNTVDNHKARIMRKLGIHKTVGLVRFAVRHGIVNDV
jgi:DNA-binding NarL/FixJ family response regulator